MGTVYKRADSPFFWIGGVDANGKPWAKSAKTTDRREAEKTLADIEAAIAAGSVVAAAPQTFAAYGVAWCTERGDRRDEEKVWTAAHELGRLKHYVFPVLGNMKLADIRPRDVRALVKQLKTTTSERTGEQLASRTIRNILGVVSTLFRDAVADELIEVSPYVLKSGDMPAIVDKDPEWRDEAVYTRAEVEQLISDERLPLFHRVWWALGFFTGMRANEVAALYWKNLVTTETPLQQLKVRQSYNAVHKRLKGTKNNRPRLVPVHPVLAAILAEWRLSGWAELNGRPATAEDLLLTNSRGGRFSDSTSKKTRPKDLRALGLRVRRFHDARSTFIGLGTHDGGDEKWLERVTHNAKGSTFNQYLRKDWLKMCEAVSCLQVRRGGARGELVALPVAANSLRQQLRSEGQTMEEHETTGAAGVRPEGFEPPEEGPRRGGAEGKAGTSLASDRARSEPKGTQRSDVAKPNTADQARRARVLLFRFAGGRR